MYSERYISSFEGLDIVDAFSNTSNSLVRIKVIFIIHAFQSSDESELVLRFSASNHLQVANDLIKGLLISKRVGYCALITVFDLTSRANDITYHLPKLCGVHGMLLRHVVDLFFGEDTCVHCHGFSGV